MTFIFQTSTTISWLIRLTVIITLMSSSAYADELDQLLSGFEEDNISVEPAVSISEQISPWDLSGRLSLFGNYAYSHLINGNQPYSNGLSRLQTKLELKVDYRVNRHSKGHAAISASYDAAFAINGRETYPTVAIDRYEQEIELGSTWWQTSLTDQLDIKIGRQKMMLGKADMVRINDSVNPFDNRYPGLLDVEDLRLPVSLSRLDYYNGNWKLSGSLIHESRLPKNPVPGVDAFPASAFNSSSLNSLPPIEQPKYKLETTPFMLAAEGVLREFDLSLYRGRILDSRWHLHSGPTLTRRYGLINQTGFAIALPKGHWLLKVEAASFSGLQFSNTPLPKTRNDLMVGFDYSGWSNVNLTLELVRRHIEDFELALVKSPDFQLETDWQLAANAKIQFNHDRSSLNFVITANGENLNGGGLQRFWLDHEVGDQWELKLGVINYVGGSNPLFQAQSSNDKYFFDLLFHF